MGSNDLPPYALRPPNGKWPSDHAVPPRARHAQPPRREPLLPGPAPVPAERPSWPYASSPYTSDCDATGETGDGPDAWVLGGGAGVVGGGDGCAGGVAGVVWAAVVAVAVAAAAIAVVPAAAVAAAVVVVAVARAHHGHVLN